MLQFASLLMVAVAASQAQPAVPVWDGSLAPASSVKGELCNLAIVRGLEPSGRLNVRAGPGPQFPAIDFLSNEHRVYTCNERDHWYGVVYGGPDAACGTEERAPLDIRLTRPCRSGWVHRRWIEIITG